ncbi:MAG: hypothetical protein K0S32_4310 [Bacteroidetes bacterium]|jgi:hypothetical protein|nr:hypothetical protein [Bacteroidota bacterium]
MEPTEQRKCLECNEIIKGRIDKKYCNDMCRNSFNNRLNSDSNNYVRNINNTLRKNRRILEAFLNENEKITVPKQKLMDKGFNFSFYTNQTVSKNNNQYLFCYEYGYTGLEKDITLIIKREEER